MIAELSRNYYIEHIMLNMIFVSMSRHQSQETPRKLIFSQYTNIVYGELGYIMVYLVMCSTKQTVYK